ncbi:MAG TPA: bifunctional riboflavin kinase/FAD synthetase [Candidatus Avisuccinivibrio pullicola]|nr:bifunctional riboflavin kinase/FAD synthetase [Candidatus Avisuccinivibrio pullicola]
MRLYRQLSDFKGSSRGIALAIGNFDGFHQGHRAVIAAMKEKAQRLNLESAVMIFEPQPLEFFKRAVPPRLYSLRDKIRAFKAEGIDILFCMRFKEEFARLSPRQFVIDLLHERLNVKSVTVGSLFSFGEGGTAGLEELKALAESVGMEASAIHGVAVEGMRISSTMIRALLEGGDLETVAVMLGRPYSISGRVVRGNEIGRTIGFPTANVNLKRQVCPLRGVFAVRVETPYGTFDGMANVGERPTVGDLKGQTLLEVNLFGFNADLYGKSIEVRFVKKIRDEHKFPDLQALMRQISHDREVAQKVLKLSNV